MKYQIIYADPPWDYVFGKTAQRRVSNHYSVMDKNDISKLAISELADDNCVLIMWCTMPILKNGIEVLERWGFRYSTSIFTWIKTNKITPSLFWGMGYYTRSNPELCLLGIKGKPLPRLSHSIHSVITSPIRDHSRKPDEVRNRIVELFGDVPRIELFARQKTDGWDVWGNEVESDIIISPPSSIEDASL